MEQNKNSNVESVNNKREFTEEELAEMSTKMQDYLDTTYDLEKGENNDDDTSLDQFLANNFGEETEPYKSLTKEKQKKVLEKAEAYMNSEKREGEQGFVSKDEFLNSVSEDLAQQ